MPAYVYVLVELVEDQAHRSGQVGRVSGLAVQRVLEGLEVLHPLAGKAVVNDVVLQEKSSLLLNDHSSVGFFSRKD